MRHSKASEKYLVVGMIISMFLWGLGWPSGKVLTHYCSVINFSVYRYTLVVIAMLVLLPSLGLSIRINKRGIPVFLISGVLLAVYSYFFFMGLKNGAAGAGGVLVTIMNPIMAYAIGIVQKRKLPAGNEIIGLVLGAIAGCVLLKVWDSGAAIMDSGNLYFLLCALTWAVMSKFTAKGGQYGSSLGFSLWQYLVTLFCMVPFFNWQEANAMLHIKESVFWLNLFFSSIGVTAIATTVYFYTTTRLGAEKASSFIFLVPLGAAISAWAFIGERIQIHTAIGGVLGIAAVYVINRKKKAFG